MQMNPCKRKMSRARERSDRGMLIKRKKKTAKQVRKSWKTGLVGR